MVRTASTPLIEVQMYKTWDFYIWLAYFRHKVSLVKMPTLENLSNRYILVLTHRYPHKNGIKISCFQLSTPITVLLAGYRSDRAAERLTKLLVLHMPEHIDEILHFIFSFSNKILLMMEKKKRPIFMNCEPWSYAPSSFVISMLQDLTRGFSKNIAYSLKYLWAASCPES